MINFSDEELKNMRFKHIGKNINMCKSVLIINPENISIDDNSRIDAFGILSSSKDGINIGKNVHIAAGCYLYGGGGEISLEDFSNLSSKTIIYTSTDDFLSGHIVNATVPEKYRNLKSGKVIIKKHAAIGAASIIFPNVTVGIGASAGAMTLIKESVGDCLVVVGNPMRVIKIRGQQMFELEEQYLKEKGEA